MAEIYKQSKNTGFSGAFYHLRTLDGREIDLLIETADGYYAIEIKNTRHVHPTDGRNLNGLDDLLDKPVLQKIVLSHDPQAKNLGKGITAIPAALFLG